MEESTHRRLHGAGPPRAHRADPARRGAALGCDPQRDLAAALGLGLRLWLAGLLLWIIGQAAAVWAAKRDPQFVDVVRRHLRISSFLGGGAMMNLREYRRSTTQLADHLPWAALVDRGRPQQGRLLSAEPQFRGPDLECHCGGRTAGLARLNNALRRFGSGWALFFEAERLPASNYPEGHFPEVASALVQRAPCGIRAGGYALPIRYFLTLFICRRAEQVGRAERCATRDAAPKMGKRANCRVHRPHRPRPRSWRLYARNRGLDDDETLTYLHDRLDQAAARSPCRRYRCTSTPSWRTSHWPVASSRCSVSRICG